MLKNNLARVGQVFRYFFVKYDENIERYAVKNLSEKECEIWQNMAEYDRVHCYKVAVEIEKRKEIFPEELWIKAALLHDCGKDRNIGFIERVLYALFKFNGRLKNHPESGYEKLKNINSEIAEIVKLHHNKNQTGLISEFQKIDDLC